MTHSPKTYFLDIDGTLLKHLNDFQDTVHLEELPVLPEVVKKVGQWHCKGHTIIITTGRAESMRAATELQLQNAGIVYDQLIMGLSQGVRVLVNDHTNSNELKAEAYSVLRNVDGLKDVP